MGAGSLAEWNLGGLQEQRVLLSRLSSPALTFEYLLPPCVLSTGEYLTNISHHVSFPGLHFLSQEYLKTNKKKKHFLNDLLFFQMLQLCKCV